jgi:hypothetical protein
MKIYLTSLLIIALLSANSNAALITGTTIQSATVGLNGDMGPENAINGDGLSGGVPTLSDSHEQRHSSNWWSGWAGDVTEWQITVDLEDNYSLDVIHIWNYREGTNLNLQRGLRAVEIWVSSDGDAGNLVKLITDGSGEHDGLSGGFIFPVAPGDAEYLGFDLDVSGVTNAALLDNARLFRIDGGSDTWTGGTGWGGLAEIHFGGGAPILNAENLQLVITPNGANYDFSWESKNGKIYDLVSNTELVTAPETWPVWDGQADVTGTEPTNMLIDVPGGGPTRFFAVVEKVPPPLLQEGFEGGLGAFTIADHSAGGTGTDWTQGVPMSGSVGAPNLGGFVESGNGASANGVGTDIGTPGFHTAGTDTCLRSGVIDLTDVTGATLSFAEALDIEGNDTAVVNIIDDTDDNPATNIIATAIYTATDGDLSNALWTTVAPIAIPAAALGQAVRIEWRFSGAGGADTDYMGWYIDDVSVQISN